MLLDEDDEPDRIGNLTTETGPRTTLDLTHPGRGRVLADHSRLDDSQDGLTAPIDVAVGALDNLALVQPPTTTPADENATIEVVPEDADGNERADRVNFTLNGSGRLDRVDETTTQLVPDETGEVLVTAEATADDRTAERTLPVDVTPGALDHLEVTQAANSTPSDEPVQLTIEPQDANGNARADRVNFSLEGSGELDRVDANTTRLVPNQTGTVTIQANASDPANQAGPATASHSVEVTVGSLAEVTFEQAPSSATAGRNVTYQAQALDANGNPRSDPLNFTLANGTGTGTITDDGTLTARQAGNLTVTATARDPANLTTPVSVNTSTSVHPGPLEQVTFEQTPASTPADNPVTLDTTALDAQGNERGDDTRFEILNGTGQVDDAGLFDPDQVGPVTIQATATDDANATTANATTTVEVTPGAPTQLSIDPASRTVQAGADTLTYDATARDENGNEVPIDPSQDVAWSIDASGASFSGDELAPPTRTDAYAVSATLVDHPSVAASARLVVQPGPVQRVDVDPSNIRLVEEGETDLTGTPLDAFGNPTRSTVRWSTPSSILDVNATTGTVSALQPGQANVTAAVPDAEAAGRVSVRVVEENVPLDHLDIDPADVSLEAGETVDLAVTPIDEEGEAVTGLEPTFEVDDDSVALLRPGGQVLGNGVGRTNVTVEVASLEARVPVEVSTGAPAQIRVTPTTATLDPGESLDLDANVTDVRHNEVEDANVDWSLTDASDASVDTEGNVTAGSSTGSITVEASSGAVSRTVVLHVTQAQATRDETVNVTTTTTEQTVQNTVQTTHTAGLSETQAGSTVNLTPSQDDSTREAVDDSDETNATRSQDRGAFEGANVEIDEDARNVAIAVETQEGSLSVTPDEVDLPDLDEEVDQRSGGSPPGLFVTVTASADGEQLDSDRLNSLIGQMDTRFRIPAQYFETHSLEPDDVVLAEYSEGERVGTVGADLVREDPVDGFFRYETTLTEFSSFAAVAEDAGGSVSTGGGGGGGGGSGGASTSSLDALAVDETFTVEDAATVNVTRELPDGLAWVSVELSTACEDCAVSVDPIDEAQAPPLPQDLDPRSLYEVHVVQDGATADGRVSGAQLAFHGLEVPASDGAGYLVQTSGGPWVGHSTTFSETAVSTADGLGVVGLAVDERGPGIEVAHPAHGDRLATAATISAWVNDSSGPEVVEVALDGEPVDVEVAKLVPSPDEAIEDARLVTHHPQDLEHGKHTVQITAKDSLGQTSTRDWWFQLDPTCPAPEIVDVRPADGADGIEAVDSIEARLDGARCSLAGWTVTATVGDETYTSEQLEADLVDDRITASLPDATAPGQSVEVDVTVTDVEGRQTSRTWSYDLQETGEEAGPAGGADPGDEGPGTVGYVFAGLALLATIPLVATTVFITWKSRKL